jgi:4-amino-4-deoxy-L-arabinose transferase-like glycosyltransferase
VDEGFFDSQALRLEEGKWLGFSHDYAVAKERETNPASPLYAWVKDTNYHFGIVPCDRPTAFLSPGYPYFLAGIYGLFGHDYRVARLIQALLGALLVFPVFALARLLFGEKEALLAALAVTVYPFFIYYTGFLITETLYMLLLAVAVLFAVRLAKGGGYGAAVISGLAFGLTFHVRSGIFLALPVVYGGLLLGRPKQWRQVVVSAAVVGAVLAPWVVRNYVLVGHPVLLPTNGAINLWMRNHPAIEGQEMAEVGLGLRPDIERYLRHKELLDFPNFDTPDEVQRNAILKQRMTHFILANPRYFTSLCARRLVWLLDLSRLTRKYRLGWPMRAAAWLSYPPILLLGALGMVLLRRRWVELWPMYAVILVTIGAHTLLHGGFRYRMTIDPFLIVFAASALLFGIDKAVRTVRAKRAADRRP